MTPEQIKQLRHDDLSGTDKFFDRVKRRFEQACEHMDPDQLTSDQAFAVAFFAGVDWYLGGEYGTIPTTPPCAFFVREGKWEVHVANHLGGNNAN